MENVKDSLIDLERHRLRLEENIAELKNALQHWRTWDAEYEALKEEVESISGPAEEELQRIQNEFEGELLNRKEVTEIIGQDRQRSQDQIVNILDRRIDYVSKSIESLQKQIETAERKHATASIVSQPDMEDDEGQPITEIVEELDADDNVLSYKLNQPGQSMNHVREALQKAGVKDLPPTTEDPTDRQVTELPIREAQEAAPTPATKPPKRDEGESPRKNPPASKKAPKKTVSFADDTEPAEEVVPPVSRAAVRVENIMKTAKEQEEMAKQTAVIPENEDPEEAALRRQMLNYGMDEVGAVVAELHLEEGGSDMDDDGWDYSDEGYDEGFDEDEGDDDEDKYGRSTLRIVTEDYRQRMLELEQRLGIQSKSAAKQKLLDEENSSDDERVGRIVVKPQPSVSSPAAPAAVPEKPATKSTQTNGKSGKKGVRFAESLDIAPDDPPAASVVREKEPVVEPHGDVVERSSTGKGDTGAKAPRKASRFKKAREGVDQNMGVPKGPMDIPESFTGHERLGKEWPAPPTGPSSTTIADKLVERDIVSHPMNEDDFEDMMDQDALLNEHQRLRRKFIQRQGGFLKEDESPIQPLDETEGGPERHSRFKAARLSRQ